MSENKQVHVNSEYLKFGGRKERSQIKKQKSVEKKEQLVNVNNSSVKELLLKKLKEYRKQKKEKRNENIVPNQSLVATEFLDKIKRKKNKTENVDINPLEMTTEPRSYETTHMQVVQTPAIRTEAPQMPVPQYSNMKNSSLPTYREFLRKTQKSMRKPAVIPKKKFKQKNFKVGKNKTSKTVGIFLKNTTMKNKVDADIVKWSSTNVKTVKNYLKKRNLIHYGTTAPNDLLREMYVSSNVCGNVENTNGTNLVDNYLESN